MGTFYNKASLVMIPSAVKDGKLYSVKPTNGDGDFTFSRGSNLAATRVNASGFIEKGRENLLLQSNQFDTTWTQMAVSVSSNQEGYNGTSNAFKISETAETSQHVITQTALSVNVVQCVSVYAKKSERDWLMINQAGNYRAYYNLLEGTIGSSTSDDLIDTTITHIGNGWYRCTYTAKMVYPSLRIGPTLENGANSYPGDLNSGIFIQDAQLEQGLVATDYIETGATTAQAGILENMPRLDYSGGASFPSLLLEPQRTNLLQHSEYFNSTNWSKQSGVSVTDNTSDTLSPEGLYNASKITSTLTNTGFFRPGGDITSNSVVSIYLKGANGGETCRLADASGTGGDKSITLTADWERYDLALTYNGTDDLQGLFVDNINGTIYAWGAQFEIGTYPTSYIPTYGTSVTRTVDKANATGTIQPYRFGGGAFSIFLEHDPIPTGSDGPVMLLHFTPLNFYFRYSNDTVLNIWNQEIQEPVLNGSGVNRSTKHKILMVYDGVGSTDVYIDGVKRKSGYSHTWSGGPYYPKLDSTAIITGNVPLKMNQVAIFDEALSEAKSITLTTLN